MIDHDGVDSQGGGTLDLREVGHPAINGDEEPDAGADCLLDAPFPTARTRPLPRGASTAHRRSIPVRVSKRSTVAVIPSTSLSP